MRLDCTPFKPGFPFWLSWHRQGSRSTAALQRFAHYCHVRYSFRCRSGLRIRPIVPFQRPPKAFWQQLARADPRQPAYAGLSGPSALASRHR